LLALLASSNFMEKIDVSGDASCIKFTLPGHYFLGIAFFTTLR
jgi:hypothetical protein